MTSIQSTETAEPTHITPDLRAVARKAGFVVLTRAAATAEVERELVFINPAHVARVQRSRAWRRSECRAQLIFSESHDGMGVCDVLESPVEVLMRFAEARTQGNRS